MPVLSSADFSFKINVFEIILSGTVSECQIVSLTKMAMGKMRNVCSLNMLSAVSLCSKLKLVLPSWIKYIRIMLSLVQLII